MIDDPLEAAVRRARPTTNVDPFLQRLAALGSDDPRGEGIMTLVVTLGGTIIRGRLTSGRAYFKAVMRSFQDEDPPAKVTASGIAETFSIAYPTGDESPKQEPDLNEAYLYLMNAKVCPSGQEACEGFAWWRVRLSSVDGVAIVEYIP